MPTTLLTLRATAVACLLVSAAPWLCAATVSVNMGAAVPFPSLSAPLRPQVQSGSHHFTWSDGAHGQAACDDIGGALGLVNVGLPKPPPPGVQGGGGTGYQESWVACDISAQTYPTYEATLAAHPDSQGILRVAASHELPAQSMLLDDTTGVFQGMVLNGSTLAGGTRIAGTLTGGAMQASNLRVDLINRTITADLVGTKAAVGTTPAVPYSAPNTVLWTFDAAQGPTTLNPSDLARSDRDTVLASQGYAVGSNGVVTATLMLKNLQLTAAGQTFANNALGLSSLGVNATASVNSAPGGWGDITVTATFQFTASQALSAQTGQTVTTPYTLPGGVPLRIAHLSTSSALDVQPQSYDTAAPALSMQGVLPWFNVFNVQPTAFPGGLGSSTPVQDPRFPSDQFEGQTRIRIRTTSSGKGVSFDNLSGALISFSGFRHDMVGDFLNSGMQGGLWSAQNLVYRLADTDVVADLSGAQGALGTVPGQAVAVVPAATVWRYATVTGPSALPLQALSAAGSASALPTVLQNAGFTVNTVTSSAITFTGAYKFAGLMLTPVTKDYICLALACSPHARRGLMAPDTDYLGQFLINVRFSLPLTAP